MHRTCTNTNSAATDENASAESGSSAHELRCEHCGEPFQARKHGGGKPQKFCGEQCRMAHYANAKRDGSKTNVINEEASPKIVEKAEVSAPIDVGSNKDEEKPKKSLLVPQQAEITCHWNEYGDLVVWQASRDYYEDDTEIIVTWEYAEEFAKDLLDFVRKR